MRFRHATWWGSPLPPPRIAGAEAAIRGASNGGSTHQLTRCPRRAEGMTAVTSIAASLSRVGRMLGRRPPRGFTRTGAFSSMWHHPQRRFQGETPRHRPATSLISREFRRFRRRGARLRLRGGRQVSFWPQRRELKTFCQQRKPSHLCTGNRRRLSAFSAGTITR